MSTVPSIAASGLALLGRGEERLAASARAFTRMAGAPEAADANAAATGGDDAVDAAVGVVYGRTAFESGVALLRLGRDTAQALIDVLA
jgi:hypothetical protein